MSSRGYDLLVDEGKEQEKKYDWIAALELYKKALIFELERDDLYRGAKISERIGFCYHRAAMQARNRQEFRNRMLQSANAYSKASELLDQIEDPRKHAEMYHFKALTRYVNSLLSPESASRKRSLDECLKLEREALEFYKETSDDLCIGKTCSDLSFYLVQRLNLEWDKLVRLMMLKEALRYGEKGITILSERGREHELARACLTVSIHYSTGASGLELESKRKHEQKALSYSKKALELSEKIGDRFLLGMSNISLGSAVSEFTDHPDSAIEYFENALQCGIDVKDNRLIGRASYCLASSTCWRARVAEEDLEKKKEESKRCQRYSEDAIHHFNLVSNDQEIASSYCWLAENYNILAESVETSSEKKRLLLKRSIKAGRKGLGYARRSGSIGAAWLILHPLSKSLFSLSTMERDADAKKRLLEESLQFREESIETLEQAMPYFFWNQGVRVHYLALIQAELARIEKNDTLRVKLLEDAGKSAKRCINLCLKDGTLSREQHAVLGGYYFDFGGILNRLYELTGTSELLARQAKVFEGAIKAYKKAGLASRVAEGHWQLARAQNKLQDYIGSAESFEAASGSYEVTANKLLRLKSFYLEYARYMQAWSEIEKARHHHARQEHYQAMTCYEKVSVLHESLKSWKHFAPNYLAWVRLEQGEGLSRGDKTQEARQAFRKAAELFSEAKKTLQDKLETIENANEKNLTGKLIKASDARKAYCLGRVLVEEGKILDRKGDCLASSKKYRLAANMFQEIAEVEPEQSRKELLPIIYLCQAWQKMMMAEARTSSKLYGEAAKLFNTAKKHTIDKQTSSLALANSSFCRALEAGTEFEITRSIAEYSTAKRHLEAASSFYLKSGFKSASEYARATQRLFDAYVYMSKAEIETDLKSKAQCYLMARQLLQASASSYRKAKYPEKSEEIQRLLESVKKEQRLIMSLTDVLHVPTVASTTSSFTTPTPTHEKAVGLDKFEHAAIEVNLSSSSTKATAGENINLEIQIANVGKEAALLTKIERILPQGFRLVAKPIHCSLEGTCLEMKGRKLGPLGTEDVKLVLRSFTQGRFAVKPRIVCVDGTGSELSCEPEPLVVEVSEVTLSDHVATGCRSLDCALFGGIPKDYAVILTSTSCDERELLIKRFLEVGAQKGQVTFYVTTKSSGVDFLPKEYESDFYLFICNPQVNRMIESLPHVFKSSGVDNLTDISIAVASASRKLTASPKESRRACIEIISDVLLQHHAVSTRRWLSGLITDLKSKGFTTLAVMNPQMHSQEEVQAILGLFEGEINIYDRKAEEGRRRFLRVTKMHDQRYLKSEFLLGEESFMTRQNVK